MSSHRFAERSSRKDVVARARLRVWAHSVVSKGLAANIGSAKDVELALQRRLPKHAWPRSRQLARLMEGKTPRALAKKAGPEGTTLLDWVVAEIDSLEGFRGTAAVYGAPLFPLLAPEPDIPRQLSDSVDRALEALSLFRMSQDDCRANWVLVNGSKLERVDLSVTHAARRFSFSRSVDYCLGTTAGQSEQRLVQVLYALALLHLESSAVTDYVIAGTVHGVIDRVTSSAEYKTTFGCFADEIRKILRSRAIWRPIELLVDEPCESKTSRSSKSSQKHATTAVRVDRSRIGCVIVPVSAHPGQMDAHTFKAITLGFKGSG